MQIKEILLPGLKTIPRDASMAEAEKILRESRIRHLPVTNGREVIGILSDKDIERASTVIISDNKTSTLIQPYKKVADYMTTPVLKMKDTDTVEKLTQEMVRRKISSFIIEDDNSVPVGIITTEDLLLLLLDKLNSPNPFTILKKIFKGFSS